MYMVGLIKPCQGSGDWSASPKRYSKRQNVASSGMKKVVVNGFRNRYRELRPAALALSHRIAEHRGVAGVFVVGGLVRGYLDEGSDLDIVVLLKKHDSKLKAAIRAMGREESERLGVDVDLEVHTIRSYERLKRDDNRRWECSHAEVLHDSEGRTLELLSSVVDVPDSFWTDRIVGGWTYFQWYAFNPDFPKTVAEMCMDRGDRMGAHYSVNYSVDLLLELLYALNREFLPPPKWRMAYLKGLEWKPRGLGKALEEAIVVKDMGPEGLQRRLRAVRSLHGQLRRRVHGVTGLSEEQFWKHFLKVFVFEE